MAEMPKLLCVDDNPTILSSVQRLLGEDFTVLTASSADEALTLVEKNPDIAVVLTDYGLAGKNGLQLLKDIQTKAPDAIRAIVSGQIDVSEMVEAINTSLLHRFIMKPWDNEYFRVQMLEALANHSTLVAKRELETLSVTDAVTTLKNHRYFQDRLRLEIERAERHKRPLALAMIDIDHFKAVNDRYGHPVGDLLLRVLAQRMSAQLRSIDILARYGGEEFTLIMPDTEIEDALNVSERMRKLMEKNEFLFPNLSPIKVTLSIGVAALSDELNTPAKLIERADSYLYQAKGQGRNQTIGA